MIESRDDGKSGVPTSPSAVATDACEACVLQCPVRRAAAKLDGAESVASEPEQAWEQQVWE